MKEKSTRPTYIVAMAAMLVIQVVVAIFVGSGIAGLVIELSFALWVAHGYKTVFKCLPAVATLRDALRGFILAVCWPLFGRGKKG